MNRKPEMIRAETRDLRMSLFSPPLHHPRDERLELGQRTDRLVVDFDLQVAPVGEAAVETRLPVKRRGQ